MENVRLLVLDVIGGKGLYEANIGEKLEDFYEHLKCSCFDIAHRKIGGKWFDIFCDDEGLFKDSPIPSAIFPEEFNKNHTVALVGNLIFANHDYEGNTTALSDEDINNIKNHIGGLYEANRSLKSISMHPVVLLDDPVV